MLHSDRAANAAKYGVVEEELNGSDMYVTYANETIAVYMNNTSGNPAVLADRYYRLTGEASPIFVPFARASEAASTSASLSQAVSGSNVSQLSEVWWFLYYLNDLYGIPAEATRIENVSSNIGHLLCGDDIYLSIKYLPEKDYWSLIIYPQ